MSTFKVGEIAYLIESGRFIREGKIIRCTGGIYLFRFIEGGATQVKQHRLYHTEEEAQAELDRINGKNGEENGKRHILPYETGA